MGGLLGKWRREISDQPGRYWAYNDVPTNGGKNIHGIIFTYSNSIRIASFVMNTEDPTGPESELAAVEFSAVLSPGYFFSAPASF